jgi:hypothetical protein
MLHDEPVRRVRIDAEAGVRQCGREIALVRHGQQPIERSPTHEDGQAEPAQRTARPVGAGEPGGAGAELRPGDCGRRDRARIRVRPDRPDVGLGRRLMAGREEQLE